MQLTWCKGQRCSIKGATAKTGRCWFQLEQRPAAFGPCSQRPESYSLFPERHVHKAAVPPFLLFLLGLSLALGSFLSHCCLVCLLAASCHMSACLVMCWEVCWLNWVSWCLLPWCMNTNLSWSMVLAPLKGSRLSSIWSLVKTALGLVVSFLLSDSCRWYRSKARKLLMGLSHKILSGGGKF